MAHTGTPRPDVTRKQAQLSTSLMARGNGLKKRLSERFWKKNWKPLLFNCLNGCMREKTEAGYTGLAANWSGALDTEQALLLFMATSCSSLGTRRALN